jgi:hypothetical protein
VNSALGGGEGEPGFGMAVESVQQLRCASLHSTFFAALALLLASVVAGGIACATPSNAAFNLVSTPFDCKNEI